MERNIVIGVAAIVPRRAMADSLMDKISFFVEDPFKLHISNICFITIGRHMEDLMGLDIC